MANKMVTLRMSANDMASIANALMTVGHMREADKRFAGAAISYGDAAKVWRVVGDAYMADTCDSISRALDAKASRASI